MTAIRRHWWIVLLIAASIAAVILSITDSSSSALKNNIKLISHKGFYYVGILQSDSLPEQEKMVSGVKAALASKGYREKDNVMFEVLDAKGDAKALDAQAKSFVKNKKDMIIAVGTDSAKACAKETKTIPIVGVGVFRLRSDPSFENNYNLTGISDMPAVLNQVRMASKIFPINTLGVIFNPKDENAVLQLELLREVGEKKGIRLYEVAFDENTDSAVQIGKFQGHVDAVYIPADETVLKSFDVIAKTLTQMGIPIIGESAEMVRRGALLSISAEYYRMGFSGGRIASQLLEGKEKPYEIAVTRQMDPEWVVNMSAAKALNKKLPNDVWQRARKLYLYDGQAARP